MSLANFVPLLVATILVVPLLLVPFDTRVDRVVTRLAIRIFGSYVDQFKDEFPDRKAALRAAHIPQTYRVYAAKTLFVSGILAAVGSVLGIYLIWGVLWVLAIDAETLRTNLPDALSFLANFVGVPSLTIVDLFALMVVSSLTLGAAAGTGTYWLRWWYPTYRADNRARRIEAGMPATVAFVHALSRSGMEFPAVMRIVAANRDIYGDAADEFGVAVRQMDAFGMDLITAIQTMARRSPCPQFKEFAENLVSVLQSGRSLSAFLERQYHDYQEEAEAQQESLLALLATLAEAYVTVLVAGPLFMITILVVIGITIGGTLEPLQVLVYVILPFGNVAFVLYLDMVTDSLTPGTLVRDAPSPASLADNVQSARTDGGTVDRPHPNVERLEAYRAFRTIRRRLGDPIETLESRPEAILWITVPLSLAMVAWHLPQAIVEGELRADLIDDAIILAGLFLASTFAVVYEAYRRRLNTIEAAVPDLLDRLASVNEAGMPIVTSLEYVRRSDLGALDAELDRIWADIRWGADVETALRRFEGRMRTRTVSRVVTLISEAMNASGDLATVLRIAARQAAADRRLMRQRRREMVEYMVVAYVSFLVFLLIIGVLAAYLIPNLPDQSAEAAAGGVPGMSGDVPVEQYTLLFYHAAVIQGALSGLIAGQLSSGDLRSGAKHAVVMVALAYVVFTVIL